jgi:hypothetical protein
MSESIAILSSIAKDPAQYAEALQLALGSIEKVVELSKDFMNEVFPFEEFTKISEGITKELAEYSHETMVYASKCASALRTASNIYRDAVLPIRSFCTLAVDLADMFLADNDPDTVSYLTYVVDEGMKLCTEALEKLTKARDVELKEAVDASELLHAKLEADSKPDSEWYKQKSAAIQDAKNKQWFIVLGALGGFLGVALAAAITVPLVNNEVDVLNGKLNEALLRLKGYSDQLTEARTKCSKAVEEINEEKERITGLQSGLKASQFVFTTQTKMNLIVIAAKKLKSTCENYLKKVGLKDGQL